VVLGFGGGGFSCEIFNISESSAQVQSIGPLFEQIR
jgi:hypothetical protein